MIRASDVQTGKPTIAGRYLIFIRCAAPQVADWIEPTIGTWHAEHWDTMAASRVIGWIGPIAPMKVNAIGVPDYSPTKSEYDL